MDPAINQLKYFGISGFGKNLLTLLYLHEFFVYLVEILDTAVLIILIGFDETPVNIKWSNLTFFLSAECLTMTDR